jgi:hypothetical protein
MKSHFPTQKISKSQFPFYPFRTLIVISYPAMLYGAEIWAVKKNNN